MRVCATLVCAPPCATHLLVPTLARPPVIKCRPLVTTTRHELGIMKKPPSFGRLPQSNCKLLYRMNYATNIPNGTFLVLFFWKRKSLHVWRLFPYINTLNTKLFTKQKKRRFLQTNYYATYAKYRFLKVYLYYLKMLFLVDS